MLEYYGTYEVPLSKGRPIEPFYNAGPFPDPQKLWLKTFEPRLYAGWCGHQYLETEEGYRQWETTTKKFFEIFKYLFEPLGPNLPSAGNTWAQEEGLYNQIDEQLEVIKEEYAAAHPDDPEPNPRYIDRKIKEWLVTVDPVTPTIKDKFTALRRANPDADSATIRRLVREWLNSEYGLPPSSRGFLGLFLWEIMDNIGQDPLLYWHLKRKLKDKYGTAEEEELDIDSNGVLDTYNLDGTSFDDSYHEIDPFGETNRRHFQRVFSVKGEVEGFPVPTLLDDSLADYFKIESYGGMDLRSIFPLTELLPLVHPTTFNFASEAVNESFKYNNKYNYLIDNTSWSEAEARGWITSGQTPRFPIYPVYDHTVVGSLPTGEDNQEFYSMNPYRDIFSPPTWASYGLPDLLFSSLLDFTLGGAFPVSEESRGLNYFTKMLSSLTLIQSGLRDIFGDNDFYDASLPAGSTIRDDMIATADSLWDINDGAYVTRERNHPLLRYARHLETFDNLAAANAWATTHTDWVSLSHTYTPDYNIHRISDSEWEVNRHEYFVPPGTTYPDLVLDTITHIVPASPFSSREDAEDWIATAPTAPTYTLNFTYHQVPTVEYIPAEDPATRYHVTWKEYSLQSRPPTINTSHLFVLYNMSTYLSRLAALMNYSFLDPIPAQGGLTVGSTSIVEHLENISQIMITRWGEGLSVEAEAGQLVNALALIPQYIQGWQVREETGFASSDEAYDWAFGQPETLPYDFTYTKNFHQYNELVYDSDDDALEEVWHVSWNEYSFDASGNIIVTDTPILTFTGSTAEAEATDYVATHSEDTATISYDFPLAYSLSGSGSDWNVDYDHFEVEDYPTYQLDSRIVDTRGAFSSRREAEGWIESNPSPEPVTIHRTCPSKHNINKLGDDTWDVTWEYPSLEVVDGELVLSTVIRTAAEGTFESYAAAREWTETHLLPHRIIHVTYTPHYEVLTVEEGSTTRYHVIWQEPSLIDGEPRHEIETIPQETMTFDSETAAREWLGGQPTTGVNALGHPYPITYTVDGSGSDWYVTWGEYEQIDNPEYSPAQTLIAFIDTNDIAELEAQLAWDQINGQLGSYSLYPGILACLNAFLERGDISITFNNYLGGPLAGTTTDLIDAGMIAGTEEKKNIDTTQIKENINTTIFLNGLFNNDDINFELPVAMDLGYYHDGTYDTDGGYDNPADASKDFIAHFNTKSPIQQIVSLFGSTTFGSYITDNNLDIARPDPTIPSNLDNLMREGSYVGSSDPVPILEWYHLSHQYQVRLHTQWILDWMEDDENRRRYTQAEFDYKKAKKETEWLSQRQQAKALGKIESKKRSLKKFLLNRLTKRKPVNKRGEE